MMQFICKCCQQPVRAREQFTIPGRAPLIQVECITDGCANKDWTYTYREGDAESNAQVLERYTPIEKETE